MRMKITQIYDDAKEKSNKTSWWSSSSLVGVKKHRQRRTRRKRTTTTTDEKHDHQWKYNTSFFSFSRAREEVSCFARALFPLCLSLVSGASLFCQWLTLIICLYLFLSAIFKHEEKEGRLSNPARETERTTSEFLPVCYKTTVNDFRAIVSLVVLFHKPMPRTFASDVVLYSWNKRWNMTAVHLIWREQYWRERERCRA